MSKKLKNDELKNVSGAGEESPKFYCKKCNKYYSMQEINIKNGGIYCRKCDSFLAHFTGDC